MRELIAINDLVILDRQHLDLIRYIKVYVDRYVVTGETL